MTDPHHREIRAVPVAQPFDFSVVAASMRQAGADQFDPVRWHYLEALAKRTNAGQGRVKHLLEGKLAQAVEAFRARFELAQGDAKAAINNAAQHHPHAAADLQRLFNAGNFKGVRQGIAALKAADHRTPLGDLARDMAQRSPGSKETGVGGPAGQPAELKTAQYFRNTWSKISVGKRLTQALDQAPTNAGPINSHRLVLRSLALMRDISPDYLNRFTSYVDALLCLDQRLIKNKPAPKKQPPVKAQKNQKSNRAE